jgi:HAD superfamily hydrolase (TIGR01549 family)
VKILAVSFDLDDTLWPVLPALLEAEQSVDRWLREHHPDVAKAWPVDAIRALRERIAAENQHLSHDFSSLRRLTMQHAFNACGIAQAPVEEIWSIYFAARNRVELYPDALAALERIVARLPVASITNGNADLTTIGLQHLFREQVSASAAGIAKPDVRIFRSASERLGVPLENILHVGDDPGLDVIGARDAGMRTAWLNREGAVWPFADELRADLEFAQMTPLADWLDDHLGKETSTKPVD